MFPAGQCTVSCCAPTEREPNSVTTGYKHLAPPGRNPDSANSLRFRLEFTNFKMTRHLLLIFLNKIKQNKSRHVRVKMEQAAWQRRLMFGASKRGIRNW